MWSDRTVTVVLMTYAEGDSIRRVVGGFLEIGMVDEVLVVNNNAEPGTIEEVERTAARQVLEPRQGCGHAIRRGLAEASGRYLRMTQSNSLPLWNACCGHPRVSKTR